MSSHWVSTACMMLQAKWCPPLQLGNWIFYFSPNAIKYVARSSSELSIDFVQKLAAHHKSTQGGNQTNEGTDTETNSGGFYFTVASKRKIRVTATTKSKCQHDTTRLMARSNHYLDLVHSILGKWVSGMRERNN